MNRIQLKELSKSQLKGSWKMPILLTVIYIAISMLLSFMQGETYSVMLNVIMLLLTFTLGIWATVGIPNFYLEFITKGGEVKLQDALVSSNKLMKSLVYNLIIGVITFVVSFILIFGVSFGTIFSIFSTDNIVGMFVVGIIIVIVVLIGLTILYVALAQVPYIILEKDVSTIEAMKLSINMMKGYKWKYIVLELSFIGWGILSVLTFGIGFIWLIPYITLTMTNFYKDISKEYTM